MNHADFCHLLDCLPGAVLVVGADRLIHYANPAAGRLWGCPAADLVGQTADFLPKTGETSEVVLRHDPLNPQVVEAHQVEVVWQGEKATQVLLTDVTARKQQERQLQLFNQIVRQMKDPVILTDLEANIRYVNLAFTEVYGYTAEEVIGKSTRLLFAGDEEEYQALNRERRAMHASEGIFRCEFRGRRKDGTVFWVSHTSSEISLGEGEERFGLEIDRDISERKQAEAVLQQANEKLRLWVQELEQRNEEVSLLNEMGNLLQTCLERSEAIAVVNRYLGKLFREHSGALYLISQPENLLEAVGSWGKHPPQEIQFVPADCWALRRSRVHRYSASEIALRCPHLDNNGQALVDDFTTLCVPLSAGNRTLGMLHLRLPVEQPLANCQQLAVTVAERIALALVNQELTETLRRQSSHDPLTDLYNRRYIEEALEREIHRAERQGSALGVVLLDIDHLDQFNTALGYHTGDLLLKKFSQLLQNFFAGQGLPGRYESDLFILLWPEFSLQEARPRLEQIRREFRALMTLPARSQALLALSLGISIYPQDGTSIEELLDAADQALKEAKQRGGDQLVVFGERMSNGENSGLRVD